MPSVCNNAQLSCKIRRNFALESSCLSGKVLDAISENVFCYYHVGGAGGGFYSKGQDSRHEKTGKGGEGYLNGGKGGANHGGFGGGGGLHKKNRGAGGGGGYSGGSGGADEDISCGGGGGSFNNGTNQKNECCYNSAGHGKVIITFLK